MARTRAALAPELKGAPTNLHSRQERPSCKSRSKFASEQREKSRLRSLDAVGQQSDAFDLDFDQLAVPHPERRFASRSNTRGVPNSKVSEGHQ